MKGTILPIGMASFSFSLALHVLLWRLARPRSDMWALLVIFLAFPTLVAVLILVGGMTLPVARFPAPVDVAAALMLHWAISVAYIQSYPAAQAQSPSLEIADAIARSAPRGLSREDLMATLIARSLVQARVEDLVSNRLIRVEGDRYVLTPAAVRLVEFFLGLRAVLGLPGHGG